MRTPLQYARDMVGDALGAEVLAFQLEKTLQVARQGAADAASPVSQLWDPTSLFMGREWLVKRSTFGAGALTFQDLRRMAANPIIASIVQTRLNQAACFMQPARNDHDPGFRIVSDDDEAMKDVERVTALTQFISNCGLQDLGEGNLEELARKLLRDSLVLDQACGEVVPRRNREPAYVVAVDGATIRRTKRSLQFYKEPGEDAFYVQVQADKVVAEYSYYQLLYGVRNPQTNVALHGYGMSELEFLFRTVATILNNERYNSSLLAQGGINKGLLVVKKPPEPGELAAFKRDFREAVRNASSFWAAPVLAVPDGAEVNWLKLDQSQRDMEYAQLFDFLVKQACGVYQIDPSEINWSIGAAGSRTTFESRQDGKVKSSQKKGLKPLLSAFAGWMTRWVIRPIDDRYRMEFVAVAEDRREMAEVEKIEVSTSRTVNEVRANRGDPPIEGGDIILSDQYLKGLEGFVSDSEVGAAMDGMQPGVEEVGPEDGDGTDGIVDGVVEDGQ